MNIDGLIIDYINQQGKLKQFVWNGQEWGKKSKNLDWKSQISSIVKNIREGFYDPPSKAAVCKRCLYRTLCPHKLEE